MNDIEFKNLKKEAVSSYKKIFISNNLLVDEIYHNLVNTDSIYSFNFFSILFSRNEIYFQQKTITAKKNKRLSITIEGYGSILKKNLREYLLFNVIFFENDYIKNFEDFNNRFKLKLLHTKFSNFSDYSVDYIDFYNYFKKYKLLKEF